jgi:hypothetical protein
VLAGESPYGTLPVAAKKATQPSAKTSAAGLNSARSLAVRTAEPVPASVMTGPPGDITTLDGCSEPWVIPVSWMSRKPRASPAASHSAVLAGRGPVSATTSASDGPGTRAVAIHGVPGSACPLTRPATCGPAAVAAGLTPSARRLRDSASAVTSGRKTLIASHPPASGPPGAAARYTLPDGPVPRSAMIW